MFKTLIRITINHVPVRLGKVMVGMGWWTDTDPHGTSPHHFDDIAGESWAFVYCPTIFYPEASEQ